VNIPNGIFSFPSPLSIDVKSSSFADTGVYVIKITVSDGFPISATTSFTLSVTNAAPKVVTVPGDVSLVHGNSLTITTSFTLSITNAAPKVVTVPGDVSLVHG
jgi:hypothetical protein